MPNTLSLDRHNTTRISDWVTISIDIKPPSHFSWNLLECLDAEVPGISFESSGYHHEVLNTIQLCDGAALCDRRAVLGRFKPVLCCRIDDSATKYTLHGTSGFGYHGASSMA